jgi:hypothetical protein
MTRTPPFWIETPWFASSRLHSERPDVLIHAKQVPGVVHALYAGEAVVVGAVGGTHPISFVGGEEVT